MKNDVFNVITFFYLSVLLAGICINSSLKAQSTFINSSFEGGSPSLNVAAPNWTKCNGTPDVLPMTPVTLPASDGATYAGLQRVPSFSVNERISAQISPGLDSCDTYTFTVDLTWLSQNANTSIPLGNGELEIWGGYSSCDQTQLLWSSGPLTKDSWQQYTAAFSPTGNYTWITLVPNTTGQRVYVGIDNFSAITGMGATCSFSVTTSVTPSGICQGDCAIITASPIGGTAPYSYSWNPGGQTTQSITVCPSTNTSYTVLVTDANNNTNTATATLAVANNITASISGDTTICAGSNTILTASGGGNYSWSTGATTTSITVSPTTTITYSVVVSNASCTVTASTTVIVGPTFSIVPSVIDANCGGNNGTATVTINGGTSPYQYSWNNGQISSTITGLSAGIYSVIVTDINGCIQTATINITASGTPTAGYDENPPGSTFINTTVTFTDISTNVMSDPIISWLWDFGDDVTSILQNPIHTYILPGTYNICLKVTTQDSCIANICKTYNIFPFAVIAPNIFTPNGDGQNDLFTFTNLEYFPGTSLEIFNRWGTKLYDISDYKNNWDGNNCPDGTYYYLLNIPEQEPVKGFVTLLRNK